jgi:hypothetical protein
MQFGICLLQSLAEQDPYSVELTGAHLIDVEAKLFVLMMGEGSRSEHDSIQIDLQAYCTAH